MHSTLLTQPDASDRTRAGSSRAPTEASRGRLQPGLTGSAPASADPRCAACGHALPVPGDDHERSAARDLPYDQLPDDELLFLGRS
jgi:hypothetical protein